MTFDINNNTHREFRESDYLFQDLTYKLIGIGMEVHRHLGYGFAEVVYKDALEEEFRRRRINFEREKRYEVEYKGIVLPHHYFADFVIDGRVILEIKAQVGIHEEAAPQVINYLAASRLPVGLIINFGEGALKFKRVAFSRKHKTPIQSA
jgi:GxxExxY protein